MLISVNKVNIKIKSPHFTFDAFLFDFLWISFILYNPQKNNNLPMTDKTGKFFLNSPSTGNGGQKCRLSKAFIRVERPRKADEQRKNEGYPHCQHPLLLLLRLYYT